MLRIADQLFVDILIDDTPLTAINGAFDSLFIYEGNGLPFPSLELNLHDTTGILSEQLALTEGNRISIMLATRENDPYVRYRQFRFFSTSQKSGYSGPVMKIVGVYDAPMFIQKATRESFEGNTSQILKRLAELSGLAYSGPEEFNGRTPDDSQIWRNVGKTRVSFARKLATHGWMGEGSCMSFVINSDGILTYRNLNDVIEISPDQINDAFTQNVAKNTSSNYIRHIVSETRDRSDAGMSNAWMNYGHIRINHSATGEQKVTDKITVPTNAENFPINREISERIKQSRIDYGLIDGDNVHPYYEEAEYQNLRLLSMFNQHLSILVSSPSEVDVFDPVIYNQMDIDEPDVKNSDKYIVFGKTIAVINGSTYCERIELGRHQITMPSTNLKGSETTDTFNSVSGFSISSNTGSLQSVVDVAKDSLQIIANARVVLSNLRTNGPQMIKQSLLNFGINTVRSTSMEFLSSMRVLGGAGNSDGGALGESLRTLHSAYEDARTVYGQIAKPLSDLNNLLQTVSPSMRRSVINSLPLDLDSLLGSTVSTITHTEKANRMLGIVNAVGGLAGVGVLPEVAGLGATIEKLPGFPSLPGITGTGPMRINGYPGHGYADFYNIPDTTFPGLPPYPGIPGVFGANPALPTLPLPAVIGDPLNAVLFSQQQLVSSANNLMGITQDLRLLNPGVATVYDIQTYNQTKAPVMQSDFISYRTDVKNSLRGAKIDGPLPEVPTVRGGNVANTFSSIRNEMDAASADITATTSYSDAWSTQ